MKREIARGLTPFILKDCEMSYDEIKNTIYSYTKAQSGVILTQEEENTLYTIYKSNPILLGLVAKAFYEKGYESF